MKKIIVATDSFKGTLSAPEACKIIAQQARQVFPQAEVLELPIADGGEGLTEILMHSLGGKLKTIPASDPFGRQINAAYALFPDGSAVVEMAAAAGLPLLDRAELDPARASSFGAGLLILDAIRSGAEPIFIGLGGSATVDGGTGAAAALGIRFYDQNGNPVTSGGSLQSIQSLDLSGLRELDYMGSLVFLTDVNNPLCGPNGAAFIFAPQKGADQEQVQQLEQGLKHLAEIIESETGLQLQDRPGMGAAGGFALPFVAFMKAQIRGGIDYVLDCLQFDQKLPGTDLVITGEGRTDAQSAMGKAISAVARRAKAQGVPTTVISGALTEGAKNLLDLGVTELIQATPVGQDLPTALANAELNLAAAAKAYFEKLKASE